MSSPFDTQAGERCHFILLLIFGSVLVKKGVLALDGEKGHYYYELSYCFFGSLKECISAIGLRKGHAI
jgi:hypothetical protein